MTKSYIGTKEILAWELDKDGKPGYAVKYPDGYISWSPKDVFESAYRVSEGEAQALTFGDAIHFMKQGKKVARTGWNGKGMYVRFVPSWTYTDGIDDNRKCNPLFTIKNVDESVSTWVPSINDVLAEDWQIVE
jgi:hypothetical protein